MTDTEWLRSTWRNLANAEQVLVGTRVINTENLAQYCSVDQAGNFVFYSSSEIEPEAFRQLAALRTAVTKSSNGLWRRSITLRETEFFDEFSVLIDSLVAASRNKETERAALGAQNAAYEQWLNFYRRRGGFTLEMARGLFGELQTANWLKPRRGISWLELLRAWQGPLAAPQDFVFNRELAVEVKSIQLTSRRVKINGLEQLNFDGDLEMRVLRLANSRSDKGGLSVNQLIANLKKDMDSQERAVLQDLLEEVGFDPESEFSDKFYFSIEGTERYKVDETFPKLTVQDVPNGVEKVEYQINLNDIKPHLIQGE